MGNVGKASEFRQVLVWITPKAEKTSEVRLEVKRLPEENRPKF